MLYMRGEDLTGKYREEWDAIKAEMKVEYSKIPLNYALDGGRSEEEIALDNKYWPRLQDVLKRAEEEENGKR